MIFCSKVYAKWRLNWCVCCVCIQTNIKCIDCPKSRLTESIFSTRTHHCTYICMYIELLQTSLTWAFSILCKVCRFYWKQTLNEIRAKSFKFMWQSEHYPHNKLTSIFCMRITPHKVVRKLQQEKSFKEFQRETEHKQKTNGKWFCVFLLHCVFFYIFFFSL